MPVQSKADGNVPLTPGRARYNVVTDRTETWVYHQMAAGKTLDGIRPMTAMTPVNDVADPTVTASRAIWNNLEHGGLFTLVAAEKKSLICEAIDNEAGATLTLVLRDGSLSRNMPTTFPFTIAPNEVIKAVGGTAAKKVGFLLIMSEKAIL